MNLSNTKKRLLTAAICGFSLIFTPALPAFAASSSVPANYTQADLNRELTMAAAWMQNAAEYRELCYQAYNIALERVEHAVKEHKAGEKPLAIVLDADETVLDNGAFEAGLIGTSNAYSHANWTKWCEAAEAPAMPGATKFLQAVDKLDVQIFYVTNRDMKDQYESSAKNMKAVGFPQVDREHMLFKTDSSDKMGRFEAVMKKYHVVVFLGDNEGDLPLHSYGKGQKERNAIVDAHEKEFGRRFIALPNPEYGDWVPALLKDGKFGDYWKLSPAEKSKVRNEALRKWRPNENTESQTAQ